MSKKPRKKRYNPHKMTELQYRQIRRTTFFYHGDWCDNPGALCGNLSFHISDALAKLILSRRNTWAGMLLAFIDEGDEIRVETELFWHTHEIARKDMQRAINRRELQWIERFDQRKLITSGWFMVPDHRDDLASKREWIVNEFRRNGADDNTIATLSAVVRMDRIAAQDGAMEAA
ncbi:MULTISPECIES: hypothetical protein [unclassified Oceanobacter]|uniref:hypothetical protein n=1 Tax=unclassified Oceanobacter TaxID=2620260 RepID=UPI0027337903|nr:MULTISPECIES: hypothetical protein [unclassified Oceanobacter]MDP2610059.1 hypothetical protein [Oceanobacter sp. 1_MG-2023]MDP2613305.1 hypothetical protein [Oceanobacter sp. 2_MG-2023]